MANLHKIYRDICRGYSVATWQKRVLYIKHLDNFDQGEIDDYYALELSKAVKIGLPTLAEKTAWLAARKMWAPSDDLDIAAQKDYIINAEATKKKALIRAQIDAYDKALKQETARYEEMVTKKERLFGLTAERFASQKMQFYYLHIAMFDDAALQKRCFTMSEMDEMEEDESYDLLQLYRDSDDNLDVKNVKRIAIADFFTNQFSVCGDNLHTFFCRPISQLTIHQTHLLCYGHYFKHLFQSEKIPAHLKDDPEAIEEFINKSQAMKELINKRGLDGDNVAIVGASNQDLKDMGAREQPAAMKEMMRKGVTNINDAMKVTGM